MLALDMSDEQLGEVTRLDVVKDVIQNFIEKRKYDRIGLIAFSVNPYLVSALTMDKEHLQKFGKASGWINPPNGTNIGAALAEGINRLRPLESKSKIPHTINRWKRCLLQIAPLSMQMVLRRME